MNSKTRSFPVSAMRLAILLSGTTLIAPCAHAQVPSSMGTEFWLTYEENLDLGFNGNPYLYVVISSLVNTQGELQVPSTGDVFPFTVNANQSTVVFVPSNYSYPIGAEVYYADGLRIVADDPVNVFAYHHRLYFSDATLVLPVERLGTDYLIVAHLDLSSLYPSEFTIEATTDGTALVITPSVTTMSLRPAGVPFTISLDQGEVYQLQAYGDLTGTRVRALDPTKPIAVFSGSKMGSLTCPGATDYQWTELMPVEAWASEYAVVPYKDRGGDIFKLVALQDNTTIDISGGTSVTLDSAEFVEQYIAVPTVLSSLNPFAVAQFNQSQDCNPAPGDGCMAWVPSTACTRQQVSWNNITGPGGFPQGWTEDHTLNIWTEGETGVGTFFLDGSDITSAFLPFPSTPGYWYAQLDVVEGNHLLTGTEPFQAQTSGFGDYASYAFFTGFNDDQLSTGLNAIPPQDRSSVCTVLNDTWALDAAVIAGATDVQVTDALGRVVLEARISTGNARVDLGRLVPGQYQYRLRTRSSILNTGRLLIVR